MKLKMIIKKISINYAFYGKTMENVRNRLRLEFNKKYDYRKIVKQQSKLTFKRTHKPFENCDSYSFKQKEVLKDKPIYLGFGVLELSKILMYETYYDKLQPFFGQQIFQLQYLVTDRFEYENRKNYQRFEISGRYV